MSKRKFRKIIEEIVDLYNRLHGIEAQARIIEIKENGSILVEFTGSFCHTCGVRDWVEDLAYLAKSMGYNIMLTEYIEPEDPESRDYKRLGLFKLLGNHDSEALKYE